MGPPNQLKNVLDKVTEDEISNYESVEPDASSNVQNTPVVDNDCTFNNLTDEEINLIRKSRPSSLLKLIDSLLEGGSKGGIVEYFDAQDETLEAEWKAAAAYQYDYVEADASCDNSDYATSDTSRMYDYNHKPKNFYLEIAKLVPIRLSHAERRVLRLLESTLDVSEYTDKIDVFCGGNKARRIAREIKQLCAILSGLAIAHNYDEGQRLIKNHDYAENAEFFKAVFEIGRRYKILNPERMRSSYGKLMYVLMDSRKFEVQQLLDFDCVAPVQTVYRLLEGRKNGLALLSDPLINIATMEIMPEGKTRAQIQKEIRRKENAIKELCRMYGSNYNQKKSFKFFGLNLGFLNRFASSSEDDTNDENSSDGLHQEDIEQCLYSLGDFNSYLRFNREPCDAMIRYLKDYFDPQRYEENFSLSITAGVEGSRLSHNHSLQFLYALQSLTLWREIANEMFHLWHCAERDLLEAKNPYKLKDTGQGLNRVQFSPRVEATMQRILAYVQKKSGSWVGSRVIHHGDYNVPNALIFIDKYTQVPRILSPIVSCLDRLSELNNSTAAMKNYILHQFKGVETLKKTILCDFFRHAFDGSGGDNYVDAGSCIDGRLTSAWNWCNSIEKKPFFPVFLLTGFNGFDGKF